VGLSEEFLFRGYTQYTLARGMGFWPAALCLSLVFGAAHLRNPGEGIVGAANVAVTGLVFAFALRRTGNLWLAVGWQGTFDFGETFVYSVADSGFVFDRLLSTADVRIRVVECLAKVKGRMPPYSVPDSGFVFDFGETF